MIWLISDYSVLQSLNSTLHFLQVYHHQISHFFTWNVIWLISDYSVLQSLNSTLHFLQVYHHQISHFFTWVRIPYNLVILISQRNLKSSLLNTKFDCSIQLYLIHTTKLIQELNTKSVLIYYWTCPCFTWQRMESLRGIREGRPEYA